MAATYDQLIGAAADVRELEYISALHQTDTSEVRKDASIKAEDIQWFLSSRYGIKVTEETVTDTIIQGLSGDNDDDNGKERGEGVLDLMEVVAMLLIPVFLKAAETDKQELTQEQFQTGNIIDVDALGASTRNLSKGRTEGLMPTPTGMLDYVLKMILHDVTGDSKTKTLTPDLIRRILAAYGEYSLAADDNLVQEMYQAAVGTEEVAALAEQPHAPECVSPETPSRLNLTTFAEALTSDIRLYDIRNEIRLTTNFDDVYFTKEQLEEREEEAMAHVTNDAELKKVHQEMRDMEAKLSVSEDLDRVNTFPAIDITAGTYRSKGLLVMLFSTIMITYFAYFVNINHNIEETCTEEEGLSYEFNSPWGENTEAMACEAVVSVVNWVVFFFGMSVFGLVNVWIGSIGNDVHAMEGWKPLVGCAWVLLVIVVPFVTREATTGRVENSVLYFASLAFGAITCVYHLTQAYSLNFGTGCLEEIGRFFPFVSTHPLLQTTVSEEKAVKQATVRKLTLMTRNALEINTTKDKDSILNSHHGQALKRYETDGKKFQTAGGFFWTWKRLFDSQQLFSRDGIWVPARMIAANLAQWVVTVYVAIGGFYLAQSAVEDYDIEWAKRNLDRYIDRAFEVGYNDPAVDDAVANTTSLVANYLTTLNAGGVDLGCGGDISLSSTEDLLAAAAAGENANYLCPLLDPSTAGSLNSSTQLALLNASGFETDVLRSAAYDAAQRAADDSVDALYPTEKYMVTVPIYVATVIAFLTALGLAAVYIPSVVNTISRLRCGDIPTLRNKDFNRYRCAPDQVALLTGIVFWGSLFSSVLVGGGIGLIVFFFLWQASVYYAQRLVAILCGIISVTLLRLALVCTCRCTMYRSFYRVRPGAANISIMALEWGSFALSVGYVLARAIRLLIAAATFIGRVDTPFLAHNVGRIGPLELDGYPIVHMKDVLSHEAHRHPYIEQLGVIYLMKLRYAKHFGTRAGTCWRLIFVYALMPWLHKYRIMAREEEKKDPNEDKSRLEDLYPSLNFVSLRDVTAGVDGSGIMQNPGAGSDGSEEDKIRISELEAEVQRLKDELSQSSPRASSSSPAVIPVEEPNVPEPAYSPEYARSLSPASSRSQSSSPMAKYSGCGDTDVNSTSGETSRECCPATGDLCGNPGYEWYGDTCSSCGKGVHAVEPCAGFVSDDGRVTCRVCVESERANGSDSPPAAAPTARRASRSDPPGSSQRRMDTTSSGIPAQFLPPPDYQKAPDDQDFDC